MYKLEKVISEQLVAQIWQQQLVTKLVTDSGEEVCVIFPGRLCSDGGSDFCDAVLTIGDKIIKGDIEIHVRSSQWYDHGHHKDSKYNNVVLHVVMWHDCPESTVLQNGNIIPSVCLSTFLVYPLNHSHQKINLLYRCTPSCKKAGAYFTNESLSAVLVAAGKDRFASKVASFQGGLAAGDAGQLLFKSMARALGYDKNTKPCENLADMLPLKILEERENDGSGIIHQALILGSAGLLPFQRLKSKSISYEKSEVAELETIWRSSHISRVMNQSDWQFFRVRPHNFPTRRLVALGYLVNRYRQHGLLQGILNLVNESPHNQEYRWIENGLIILGQDYWVNHSDFGVITSKSPALLGRNKAAEIVINVILPFAYAWGALYSTPELKEKAKGIYLSFPKLESNQLVRFMKQQLLLRPDFSLSASQQQGLIHIFKNYCRYKDCEECPITINLNQDWVSHQCHSHLFSRIDSGNSHKLRS